MGADNQLCIELAILEPIVGTQYLISFFDEYLLNLSVQMSFRLFNKHNMKRFNDGFIIVLSFCRLADTHPYISEPD